MSEPRVLLAHRALAFVDKPPGMATTGDMHCAPGTLEGWLAEQRGHPVWAAHQLDKDTSGIVMLVLRRGWVGDAQAALSAPRAEKRYWLLADGTPDFAQTTVRARLRKTPERTYVSEEGKTALTRVQVLAVGPRAFCARATLGTGRTHQVRVHLAHLGHPLLGEKRYRTPPCSRHPRHALHAASLRATVRGEAFAVKAPVPADLRRLAGAEGLPETGDLA